MMAGPPAIRQTAAIGAAIGAVPAPRGDGPFASNWTAEGAAWTAYATALAADPSAGSAFADGPSVPPALPLPVRAA